MNEETQKKIFEFQLLQGHLQELQKRQEIVAERIEELARTRAAFAELATVKDDSNALIPLGGENFISGKITETRKILVGIGGGVAVKRSVEAATEILEGRINEMEGAADKLAAEAQSTVSQLVRLQSELEAARKK